MLVVVVCACDVEDDAIIHEDVPEDLSSVNQSVTGTFKFMTWNISGNSIHDGELDTDIIDRVADRIVNNDVHFVGLQEVCHNQYDALRQELMTKGWNNRPSFARFMSTRPFPNNTLCDGTGTSHQVGIVIFARNGFSSSWAWSLPNSDSGHDRKALCGVSATSSNLVWCTTHIATGPTGPGQIAHLKGRLDDLSQTWAIGGDFNEQPQYASLNAWYSSNWPTNGNNTGSYTELDQGFSGCTGHGERSQEDTTGGPCGTGVKIDFLWVPNARLAGGVTGDTMSTPTDCTMGLCSGHRTVFGTAALTY